MDHKETIASRCEFIRSADDVQVCEYLDQFSATALQIQGFTELVLLNRPSLLPELAQRGVAFDSQAFGDVFPRSKPESYESLLAAIDASGIRLELNQPMRPSISYPLDWAIELGHPAVAHWLVDRGALPSNAHDTLAYLIASDDRAFFEKLLAAGVDPNSRGVYQQSLWHTMAEAPGTRNAWAIEALRENKVPQDQNNHHRTPRSVAVGRYFAEPAAAEQTLPELFAVFEGDVWQDAITRRQVLASVNWADIPRLLDLAPVPVAQHTQLWKELLRGFGKNPAWFIPHAFALLSKGVTPEKNQWPVILASFLLEESDALAALYAQAHPTVRIPWNLRSVIKAKEPSAIEAWLVHKGHTEIAVMLKATGLLNQTPADQWQTVVNGLLRQKAPATQIGPAHAQA